MKPLVDLSKWLLEKEIRTKNAISFLLALITVVGVYFGARGTSWMQELDRRGSIGLPAALTIVFLIAFLTVWLIGTVIARQHDLRTTERKRLVAAEKRITHIRKTIDSLTEWQQRFLLRYIVEQRTQIPEFEVGAYRATWDFEMEVLIQKGVVRQHRRAGVYEIEPVFLDYLREHLDPQTGELK